MINSKFNGLFPAALILSVLVTAGCGGNDNDDNNVPTPTPEPEWSLIWSDEFDTEIDESKWQFEVNCWGGGNNEHQCYTPRPDNAFVEDGVLHIVAREEVYSGPALQDDHPDYDADDTSVTRNYTSARLRTKDLFGFTYGRVEIRARLPGGQGAWPALWMLPTDNAYGGWPVSGEIDIMEAVNLDTAAANEVHGTLHYGMAWPQWSSHGDAFEGDLDYTNEFHVYALEWEADEIRWFVDGVHYQTQTSENWYNYWWAGQDAGFEPANNRAPYDQDFHLLMNLAIGGDWPGAPDTGWEADREFLIDYVRVYQCGENSEEGTGCASAVDPVLSTVAVNEDAGAPQENIFSFFDGVAGSIAATSGEQQIDVPVVANVWQEAEGNVITTTAAEGGDRGNVWAITFVGTGNVFLSIGDPPAGELENAIALNGGTPWTTHGELSFDLYIESIDADTDLLVKMDSGYPNLGQVEIDVPEAGQWQRVHIRIADLLANPLPEGTGLNIADVRNVFVLEPTGTRTARVRIDNIRLQCAINPTAQSWQADRTCGVGPVQVPSAPFALEVGLYEDGINTEVWDIGYQEFSTAGDHITESEVDIGSGDNVLDLLYKADGADGVAWLASSTPRDLSGFADGGVLRLDVNVLSWGSSTSQLMIKVECADASCSSGDYPIGGQEELGTGDWNTIFIPVADLAEREGSNLDLTQVSAGLVIFPQWGDSQGVHFQVNNARFEFETLNIFQEAVSNWDLYDCCGGTVIEIKTDPIDATRGNVVEFSYSSDTTVTYFQSSAPLDLSGWAGGTLEFDVYIEAEPEGAEWMMKTECVFPCGTGDVPLTHNADATVPTVGVWQHYRFELDDLVDRGLDLTKVDTPLVLFPKWGNQAGAVFRVDNARLLRANGP